MATRTNSKARGHKGQPRSPSIGDIAGGRYDLSLVEDTRNGKFLGEYRTYDEYQSAYNQAKGYATQGVKAASTSGGFGQAPQPFMSMAGMVDPYGDAQRALSQFDEMPMVSEDQYEYSEDVNASYAAYGDEWDEYFGAQFKNPRVADAQDRALKTKKEKNTADSLLSQSLNELAIGNIDPNSSLSRRTSRGTGVGAVGGSGLGGLEGAGLAI
jgi:hypothetical protein